MGYYTLTTLLGLLFMAASGLVLTLYLLLLVFANAFFGNKVMFYTMFALFFVGYVMFRVRGSVMDGLAREVRLHGLEATATVLEVEQVGSEEITDHRKGDWYELKLKVDATPHGEAPFITYVDQLFRQDAGAGLAVGDTVPVKYSAETGLTLVTSGKAYGKLSTGSFRVFGRLRRPAV